MKTETKRTRRTPEERAADLERRAEDLRARAEETRRVEAARASPAYIATRKALRALEDAWAVFGLDDDRPEAASTEADCVARALVEIESVFREWGVPIPSRRARGEAKDGESA